MVVLGNTGTTLAQSAPPLVMGQVTDSAGCPLAQVQVYVPGTTFQVSTDRRGEFAFDSLPGPIISLRASFVGYRSRQIDSVAVQPGRTTQVAFQLPLSNLASCTLGPPAPTHK